MQNSTSSALNADNIDFDSFLAAQSGQGQRRPVDTQDVPA